MNGRGKAGISLLLVLVLALAPVSASGAETATTLGWGCLTFSDAYTGGSREVYVESDPHGGEIFAGADPSGLSAAPRWTRKGTSWSLTEAATRCGWIWRARHAVQPGGGGFPAGV